MANEIYEYVSALDGSQMDIALMDMAQHTSEAWAVGERNGLPVGTSDETHENNAKYYAEQAARVIPETGTAAVRYDVAQVLTEEEQAQARANIGALNPTELLDLKMLGWTVPKDFAIQNYEENGVFHQRVGRVDLGDLNYSVAQGSTFLTQNARVVGSTQFSCNEYAFNDDARITANASADTYLSNMQMSYRHGTNDRIYIKNTNYTTVADFKASLRGIYLYYELTTEITRPIDGGEWVARYSNPNLLDNPFFTVNQRGQTTYTGANGSPKTVDRWGLGNGSSVTLTVGNDGITFASSGAYHAKLDQTPEPNLLTPYIGKEMTFSALINGVVESFTFTLTTTETRRGIIAGLHIYITPSTIYFYSAASAGAFSVKITAVKLELGSVSTLANDSAPNHTIEQLKCQKHYLKYGGDNATLFYGVAISATQARVLINTPVQMDSASLKGTGTFQLYANAALWAITKIEPYSVSPNGVNCTVTISGSGLADKQMVVGRINGTGSFIELYDSLGA